MLERILNRMKEVNINKSQLSKRCNLPKTTVYSVLGSEENLQNTKLETLRPIAELLGITLDYIINGEITKLVVKLDTPKDYEFLSSAEKARVQGYIDAILLERNAINKNKL